MSFIECSQPVAADEFPALPPPGEGTQFCGQRIYHNGRWATAEEVEEMLAKGAEWAKRRLDEGILPHLPN